MLLIFSKLMVFIMEEGEEEKKEREEEKINPSLIISGSANIWFKECIWFMECTSNHKLFNNAFTHTACIRFLFFLDLV